MKKKYLLLVTLIIILLTSACAQTSDYSEGNTDEHMNSENASTGESSGDTESILNEVVDRDTVKIFKLSNIEISDLNSEEYEPSDFAGLETLVFYTDMTYEFKDKTSSANDDKASDGNYAIKNKSGRYAYRTTKEKTKGVVLVGPNSLYDDSITICALDGESLVFEARIEEGEAQKRMRVTYIDASDADCDDSLWRRLEELCYMASDHCYNTGGFRPPISEIYDIKEDGVVIHLYEMKDGHSATSDWYTIDPETGKGYNQFKEEIDITEAK